MTAPNCSHRRPAELADLQYHREEGDFTIAGMTLTGGKTTGDNAYGETTYSGGAIRSLTPGSLAIENCDISGNSTTGLGADGGGIFAVGDVTVTSSTISGNSSRCGGGGISGGNCRWRRWYLRWQCDGHLEQISGNSSFNGGGIAGYDLTVNSSTISANSRPLAAASAVTP